MSILAAGLKIKHNKANKNMQKDLKHCKVYTRRRYFEHALMPWNKCPHPTLP